MKIAKTTLALGLLCASVMTGAPAKAQSDSFYAGKTVNLYIGFAAGGSYDLYARTLARHMGNYIPGKPTIVANTMAGAGSFRAANHMYSVAAKDGTALGMISQAVAIEEALKTPGILFKSAEFNWIGRATNATELMLTWRTSKTKTFADSFTNETPIASTGPGSPSEGYPRLLNGLMNTKFKIIGGYPASANALLAMEKGEVDSAFTSWDTLKASKQDWLRAGDVNILVQFNTKRLAELPDTPSALELARSEQDRKILGFYLSGAEVGRSFLTTPGVPAERLATLRAAFDATMKDEAFRGELARAKAELNPMSGADLQKMIVDVSNTPPDVIERIKSLLKIE
jgi:tripartite-type tricarboxylate transporter receptor subunit TctC